MQLGRNNLTPYEDRLTELWERMVRTIGIHSVNVLMDRAIFDASQKHPELALIDSSDTGLSFEVLNATHTNWAEAEAAAAFDDLNAELMLILARLLGKEMAQRMEQELLAKERSEAQAAPEERKQ